MPKDERLDVEELIKIADGLIRTALHEAARRVTLADPKAALTTIVLEKVIGEHRSNHHTAIVRGQDFRPTDDGGHLDSSM